LETERLAQQKREAVRLAQEQERQHKNRAFLTVINTPPPKAGKARLPMTGEIVTGFNAPDAFGAPSKGLDIAGREGALVVAPMGGIVRFAGYFKNYGNMIIVEHEKGYHSLIAGLKKIDTVVGQSLSAGEPVGTLHGSSSGDKPVLYYELRYNGKPVNPSQKLATSLQDSPPRG